MNYSRRSALFILGQILVAGPALAASVQVWRRSRQSSGRQVTFEDREGNTVDLAGFQGKPVVLNVWATWCAPCIIELPALDRLQRDFEGELHVVTVSIDRGGMADVLPALRRLLIRHLQPYVDPTGNIISELDLTGLPATALISAGGAVRYIRGGRIDWDASGERSQLRALLQI